jgi:PTS system mannose-specific IIA component
MTVNILLITHEEIGAVLLKATHKTYSTIPIPTQVFAVNYNTELEKLVQDLKKIMASFNPKDSLLILTDMYGSTPCNLAMALQEHRNVDVVSGLNLPMLIKVMNYPHLSLCDLTEKALQGGRDGIVRCGCIPVVNDI